MDAISSSNGPSNNNSNTILMKLIKFWSWVKSLFKHEKPGKVFIPDNDIYGMIKHDTKTRYLGARSMRRHNNRKTTKGRHVQYVNVSGITKPIYHFAS